METQETVCSPPVSDQDVLDYVARISKDLMTLAEAEGLDFLAYLLDMIHQESIDVLDDLSRKALDDGHGWA